MIIPAHASESEGEIEALRNLELYQRLERAGVHLSGTVLDVGGRHGRYLSALHSLGAETVVIIDPVAEIGEELAELYPKDLPQRVGIEAWAATVEDQELARAAVVLNTLPSKGPDRFFWSSVVESVAPGGLIVATAREPATTLSTQTVMSKIIEVEALPLEDVLPQAPLSENCFIQLWQRTE